MREVSTDSSDQVLIGCMSEWVTLMAADDFVAAVAFLGPREVPPEWTPSSLETYISNYGSWRPLLDGRQMRVTPLPAAAPPEWAQVVHNPNRPPGIDVRLPLDGEWSDLTAEIHLVDSNGGWAFTLYDLLVR